MTSHQASGHHQRPVLLLVPLLSLLLASTAAASPELTPIGTSLQSRGFEQIATSRGVRVYKHRTSKVIRIAAEGYLPASPAEVRKVLLAYERQPAFMARLREARILSKKPGQLLVYERLTLPVISDRDYTTEVRWGRQGELQWITYNAVSDLGPPKRDGIVRVTDHRGSWQIRPAGDSRSFVRFQSRIDLSGSLPLWMARAGAGKELPSLFKEVCRMLGPETNRRILCS